MSRANALALLLSLLPMSVMAQPSHDVAPPLTYDVKTLSFDRWCQEDQRLPAERCDMRLAADVTAFEDYRASVERYDLNFEKDRTKAYEFERDLLRHDYSQQPAAPDVIAPSQH